MSYFLEHLVKNKLHKEISWGFIAKGTALLLYLLLNIYLARTLSVEKFGTWSFLFSILTIILLLSWSGINISTNRYIAKYNKTKELNNILKSSIKLRIIFSMGFAIIFLLIHKPLALLIGRPEFIPLFLLSIPLILFSGFVEYLKQVFMGLHRIKYNFIINFLEFGLKLLFVILFLNFSLELFNIVNAFVIATFITSLIGFYLLYKKFYIKTKNYKQKDFTKEILKYSIPMFFISIGFLITTEIDILMLGLLAADIEVGIYAIAKQIITKLPHIAMAVGMGTMPIFAKLNKDNKEKLRNTFYKLLKINALIFSLITIGIISFSWFFIPLIFGVGYSASVLPLQILTVYMISFSFSIFLSSFLDYRGLAKKRAINMSFSMVLNIVLNFILIPQYGAVGAAIATSISYLPYVILNWLEVRKVLN